MEHSTEDFEEQMDISSHNRYSAEANLDPFINFVANIVFKEYYNSVDVESENSTMNLQPSLSEKRFPFIMKDIHLRLEKEAAAEVVSDFKWNIDGRIGPPLVSICKKNEEGSLKVKEESSLHICSSDNFSTVFGNVCVHKGKWQYEVMLGTKGVMQIGWATINCKFTKENGVGDTKDSYAYDGNRQRKWNISTHKYGEIWHCGDIISCLIDLDKGEISYFRNGRSLGVAFDNIKTGPKIAYFPAMSLAIDECMTANFGSTPFHYPQENYQALQCPPVKDLIITKSCLLWIVRLVEINVNYNKYEDRVLLEQTQCVKKNVAFLLLAQQIGSALAPLLDNSFVVEATLVPILDDMAQVLFDRNQNSDLHLHFSRTFIDYLMAILEEDELKKVASSLISCLQSYHRRVSQTVDYFSQKRCLKILFLLLTHTRFRKFCLQNILFENYRFYNFTAINCIDKLSLKIVPNINYYASKEGDFYQGDKESYLNAVRLIESSTKELEDLQVKILRLMFTADDDEQYNKTSRAIFLAKFRIFLKDQYFEQRGSSYIIPTQDILSLFHRCFALFTQLWEEEVGQISEDVISPTLFYDGVLSYHDIQRLGGLLSHLQKTFHEEKETALTCVQQLKEKNNDESSEEMVDVDLNCSIPSTSGAVLGENLLLEVDTIKEGIQRMIVMGFSDGKQLKKAKNDQLRLSLLHFLDGIILLYHHAGHKQVEKVVAQCDIIFDNVIHLQDLLKKKERFINNGSSPVIIDELNRSIFVMDTKLKEQSYQHAWNLATTLSLDSINRIMILLKLTYGVLKNASKEGNLFGFVPEFYIETLTELCQDLRHLFLSKTDKETNVLRDDGNRMKLYRPGGVDIPSEINEEYEGILIKVAEFLSLHFCDSRIIYADSKDSLIQALAGFVCHRPSLEALEKMSLQSQLEMVYNLLQPYENRAWAQNNWILVRFWKGKGFGFRYTKSPHLSNRLGPKPAHCDIPSIVQSSVPFPSELFLNHIANLLQNSDVSTPFLNSLLNQLNWVFSEFIGMLQEIQNASNRPERVFIDSRQLRICATCFDLALALLRVLEMVVGISTDIFLDVSRPNSQSLLTRLCQLMCQVLNRVSVSSGCFSHVVNLEIPGLETIHYFPILTAVTGIICELLRSDVYNKDVKSAQTATCALLSEASFQIASLYPLLGDQDALVPLLQSFFQPGTSVSTSSDIASGRDEPNEDNCTSVDDLFVSPNCECKPPKFCFRKYPDDIKNFEIKKVVDIIHHLENALKSLSNPGKLEDSDTFCTICYARFPDAKFEPCNHTSCVKCITHYLMNKRFCFFCKKPIMKVVESATSNVVWVAPIEQDTPLP